MRIRRRGVLTDDLFIVAPVLTAAVCYWLVSSGRLHPSLLSWALASNTLLWSPLEVCLPAVLCDPRRVPWQVYLGCAVATVLTVIAA